MKQERLVIRLKPEYQVTSEAVSNHAVHTHRVDVLKRDANEEEGWVRVAHAYASLSTRVHELNVAFDAHSEAFEVIRRG